MDVHQDHESFDASKQMESMSFIPTQSSMFGAGALRCQLGRRGAVSLIVQRIHRDDPAKLGGV